HAQVDDIAIPQVPGHPLGDAFPGQTANGVPRSPSGRLLTLRVADGRADGPCHGENLAIVGCFGGVPDASRMSSTNAPGRWMSSGSISPGPTTACTSANMRRPAMPS